MICSDIWHKCHGWYFEIVITQFHEPLGEWNLISQVVFMPNITTNHAISTKVRNFHMYKAFQINVPVNSSCTHLLPPLPSPRATAGHLLAFPVPGVGHLQILRCLGTGLLPTPGLFPSFWRARSFLSKYHYTRGITGKKKKQIGSSVKDIRL